MPGMLLQLPWAEHAAYADSSNAHASAVFWADVQAGRIGGGNLPRRAQPLLLLPPPLSFLCGLGAS